MSIVAHRFTFVLDRMQRGWTPEGPAAQVAWALHPFDDSPTPERKMEKEVRKRNRAFGGELNAANYDQLSSAKVALVAANDYVAIARRYNSLHFVERWSLLRSELEEKVASLS